MSIDIAQVGIVLFGAGAIWFVGRKEKWRRWGYIMGLCAQPFWVMTTIQHQQWGILGISAFYTYSWMQGIWNYWIKPDIA